MKTMTKITALSIALIFSFSTTMFAGNQDTQNKKSNNPGIRYQVNVHTNTDQQFCQTFVVEIIDQNNHVIAPVQSYLAEVEGYNFYEAGPVTGVRIARLANFNTGTLFICDQVVFAAPDVKWGIFKTGQTYTFNLYPSINPPAKN